MKTSAAALLSMLLAVQSISAAHSELWGGRGEKWSAPSRLPDFSFAGYRRGEKSLPQIPRGVSVKEFGAKGDGVADDSQAFLDAIAQVKSGAIEIPPGRYKITKILEITRSNVVLRGAGMDKTILFFPVPLNDIKPNMGATTTGQPTSNYSWSGGFIVLRGSFGSRKLADFTAIGLRGANVIEVSSASDLRVGQEVEVFESDTPANTLAVHLYSGDSGPVQNLKGRVRVSLIARITKLDGNRVHIDRSLRCDFRPEWKAQVRTFAPTVTESGVEGICFEFPDGTYKGHFTELGFNPIAFSGVAHCWARDVKTVNADSGPFIGGHFNTVQGLVMESRRKVDNQNCTGHHGVSLGGSDNLLTDFDIRMRYIHDITVSNGSAGNVASRGRGLDLALDHHRYAPIENLFCNLDAGAGTRLWKCGGGADLGKHCGARGTFWNIRAAKPLTYPPAAFGPPSMNLVALETTQPSVTQVDGKWFEAIKPAELLPQDLHASQRARRMGN